AKLRSLGLHARRGASLVRICRAFDPERLREVPTSVVAHRLERERGLGPWSVGVVCLSGLGRFERGLVGDLELIKLCAALWGRWVEGWETAELLEPYGDWQGLASVYLMAGFARGLIPGAVHSPGGVRQSTIGGPRRGEDRRVADRGFAPLRVARALWDRRDRAPRRGRRGVAGALGHPGDALERRGRSRRGPRRDRRKAAGHRGAPRRRQPGHLRGSDDPLGRGRDSDRRDRAASRGRRPGRASDA